MSFIVQVTDIALPSDATQRQKLVDRIIEEFHASDAEPSAKFAQLYQQLVAQYPCLSSYIDRTDECVWGDAPLINNFGQRIAILDIVQNEEQVLASVLKLAGDLGLKVIETQSDTVYFPNTPETQSFIVSHERPILKEKPLTERNVSDFIVMRLKPLFERAGFVWSKTDKEFQRKIEHGSQRIFLGVHKVRNKFVVYFSAQIHMSKITEIVRTLKNNPELSGRLQYDLGYFSGGHPSDNLEIHSPDSIEMFSEQLVELIDQKVLPFLEKALCLETLNSCTNNTEKCRYFLGAFDINALALAYLVSPSNIQETANIYRRYINSINYSEEGYWKPIDDFVKGIIELKPTL